MRAEDKQLEVGLEHDLVPEEIAELDEEILAPIVEEVRDEQREVLLGAMRAIFARDTILVSGLALPKRELEALGHLQAAVSGKQELGQFVFADDRRDLLEQALAILQPNLQLGIEELVGPVDALRTQLVDLEDAQEELYEWEKTGFVEAAAAAAAARDDGEVDTSLDGPERDFAKPVSDVAGPEREIAKPASEVAGPERVIAKPASAIIGVDGPALAERPELRSTLDGAPLPGRPPAGSTLYDETPIGDAPKAASAATPDPPSKPSKPPKGRRHRG